MNMRQSFSLSYIRLTREQQCVYHCKRLVGRKIDLALHSDSKILYKFVRVNKTTGKRSSIDLAVLN